MSVDGSPKCSSKYVSSARRAPAAHARSSLRATPDRWSCHSETTSRSSGCAAGHRFGPIRRAKSGASGSAIAVALGPDVDLLAPVDPALRALAADARVPAEVRALHVLDRELVGLGQGEEVARRAVQALPRARGRCRCRSGRRSPRRGSPRAGRRGTRAAASGPASSRERSRIGRLRSAMHATIGAGRGIRPYVASGYRAAPRAAALTGAHRSRVPL